MQNVFYFDIKWALAKHDDVIRVSGGLEGVHHLHLLKSVLAFIRHDGYYPTFPDKIAHLVYSVAKNHIFADGNKRTAIALGGYLMTINGYDELIPRYFIEMENIILWVASDSLSKDELCGIFEDFLRNGEFSETSQVVLFGASARYKLYLETIKKERGASN